MRPGQDLMERLVAADPLPDAEHLTPKEQHEAGALLGRLLATPAGAGADDRRPRVRRWALVAAGAACFAAAASAAIDLLDSGAPGAGVVEKAVAAVTHKDAVYHVLERGRVRGLVVQGGHLTALYRESWHASDGSVHEKLFEARGVRRGKLFEEIVGKLRHQRSGNLAGPALIYDARENTVRETRIGRAPGADDTPTIDPYGDPGTRLRDLREPGRLRLAGTTRVGDRAAYRLVSGPVLGVTKGSELAERVEFLVDSETYLPLAERYSGRVGSELKFEAFTRFLVYERLPLDARSRAQLDLDPHPGATVLGRLGRSKRRPGG
jgi:hypothetical protein